MEGFVVSQSAPGHSHVYVVSSSGARVATVPLVDTSMTNSHARYQIGVSRCDQGDESIGEQVTKCATQDGEQVMKCATQRFATQDGVQCHNPFGASWWRKG